MPLSNSKRQHDHQDCKRGRTKDGKLVLNLAECSQSSSCDYWWWWWWWWQRELPFSSQLCNITLLDDFLRSIEHICKKLLLLFKRNLYWNYNKLQSVVIAWIHFNQFPSKLKKKLAPLKNDKSLKSKYFKYALSISRRWGNGNNVITMIVITMVTHTIQNGAGGTYHCLPRWPRNLGSIRKV